MHTLYFLPIMMGVFLTFITRVALASSPVQPFSESNPLGDFKATREKRIERLCALGYASFLDPRREGWRYSPKGALTLAFRQYFTGLRRAIVPDRIHTAGSK